MDDSRKFFYGWWVVISGFIVMAVVYASVVSCQGVFTKPVTEDLGFTRAAFSLTIACMAIGLIIGSLLTGRFMKRYGVKKVMLLCCVLVGVGVFGLSVSVALWQFYLSGLVAGVALPGITTIAVAVLVNNWFGPKKKGLAMSLVFAGSGIGGMVLTVVLNQIVLSMGWRRAYAIDAVIILAVTIPLILFVIAEQPKDRGLQRYGDVETAAKTEVEGYTCAEAKKSGLFWVLFVSVLLMALVNAGLLNHQIAYFSDSGMSASLAATIAAIAIGSLAIGKIVIGALTDKIGLKKGALLGNVMLVLALTSLLLVPMSPLFAYLYIPFYCLGAAVPTVAPPLFVNALFGNRDYASIVGLVNVATGVGAIFGPTLCAKVFDVTGSYGGAWMGFIVMGVLIVVMQYMIMTDRKKAAVAQSAQD